MNKWKIKYVEIVYTTHMTTEIFAVGIQTAIITVVMWLMTIVVRILRKGDNYDRSVKNKGVLTMREILFRGKRVNNGEWVYGWLCDCYDLKGNLYPAIMPKEQPKRYDVIPESIGQYTGLIDKNGNKIFEGDIVKRPKLINDKYIDIKNISISVIDWFVDEACFTFYPNAECSDDCLSCTYCGFELEIIGNIHDNPELLEVDE